MSDSSYLLPALPVHVPCRFMIHDVADSFMPDAPPAAILNLNPGLEPTGTGDWEGNCLVLSQVNRGVSTLCT